ncbi:unnamed protein product [Ceratitis capitata]|uniref:(Mediterranean fruit fly) hypothetical protein n=1 Tax=Ceratitis capitata TaxID=7213 RepID=A0A811UV96_CERCA|nr:unnamed protein product [Ceratitis capitata]
MPINLLTFHPYAKKRFSTSSEQEMLVAPSMNQSASAIPTEIANPCPSGLLLRPPQELDKILDDLEF